MRGLAFIAVAATLGALGACGEDDPVLWQGRAAEDARDLALLDVPEVRYFTRDEWSQRAADSADQLSDETLQYYADTYGRMGYFDMSLDLRPVFAGSSSDWVGATYSPSSNVISLIGDARDDTIVHEYVHALQDDHFGIVPYDLPTSDGFLARRAAVEGDATVAQLRFIAQHELSGDLDIVDWLSVFESRRTFSADTLAEAEYPVVFLDYVSLVYTYGFEYMAYNLAGVSLDDPVVSGAIPPDWRRADAVFDQRAPDTTERILRRDVDGSAATADPVVQVGLRQVPAEFRDRLEAVDWDTLGAWYVYLLFYPLEVDGSVDARALADAWDGDTALFVAETMTGVGSVVWTAVWDDADTAQRVVDALWLLQGYTAIPGEPAHIGITDAGERGWIEARDNKIVMAINLPRDLEAAVVDRAFAGSNTMVKRRYRSLAETIEVARSHRGCRELSHRLRHLVPVSLRGKKK